MPSSDPGTNEKKKTRRIGGATAAIGLGLAIAVALIWGNLLGSPGNLGRTAVSVQAVAVLIAALAVLLPLAIAIGSRGMPAPGYLQVELVRGTEGSSVAGSNPREPEGEVRGRLRMFRQRALGPGCAGHLYR